MRRLLHVLALTAAIGLAVMPSYGDQDIGNQFGCSASSGAAVDGLVGGPSCSFDLICIAAGAASGCVYAVRISASGTGLVSAEMSATISFDIDGEGEVFWFTAGNPPDLDAAPPSCEGVFTCSAPADDESLGLAIDTQSQTLVTVRCTAGGPLAVVESVSCQATNLEFEELSSPAA